MNAKTLRVTLNIEVKPLSEDEQKEAIEQLGLDPEDDDYEEPGFSPTDYDALELAELIEGSFHEEAVREMFAGSAIYVTFGDASVVAATWA